MSSCIAELTFTLREAFGDNDVTAPWSRAGSDGRRPVWTRDGPVSKSRAVGAGTRRSEQLPHTAPVLAADTGRIRVPL